MTGLLAIPGASAEPDAGAGSISGFLWVDGNGTPPTGWDGLYNGNEPPLPGVSVSLYRENDPVNALRTTRTDGGGKYIFENLEPGSYVLGLAAAAVNGNEYLLPMTGSGQNKFAADWPSEPLMAYTSPIALAAGQAVEGIDAGMRLPMGIAPTAAVTLASLGSADKNDMAVIDNVTWYVVKKLPNYNQTGITYVLLIRRNGDLVQFNPTGNNGNVYSNSAMRAHYNSEYNGYASSTIKQIAVVPSLSLGSPSSQSVFSLPTATFVGNSSGTSSSNWKDAFFPLSYADIYEANGNSLSLTSLFSNLPLWVWGRTAATTTGTGNLWGANNNAHTLDGGLSPASTNVYANPAVWVNADAVNREIKVYYVDASGNLIGNPTFITHSVLLGDTFTLTSSDIQVIPGYKYKEWKKGLSGSPQSGSFPSPTLSSGDVIAGTDIYLIYEQELRADVTITKTVEGDYADRTKTYEFTLTFKDSGDSLLPTNTQFAYTGGVIPGFGAAAPSDGTLTLTDGAGIIRLKHGQTITVKNVPSAGKIQIAETPQDGYVPSYKDSADLSGTRIGSNDTGLKTVGAAARTFDFTNTRDPAVVPTGIGEDSRAFAALLSLSALLLLSGTAMTIFKRKSVWTRAG
ncbi:MAG: hypothetical protein FWC27_12695 [Firmicutes bacterium]|nr:hypothetical protein [Bacillota bacterium]